MISSQSEYPDLALLLLAKTTVKELNTPYAVDSGHLGILKSQADYDAYTSAEFLSATLPLLEYTTFLPNSPYWSAWSEAYYLGIQAVESGDLTPEEAGLPLTQFDTQDYQEGYRAFLEKRRPNFIGE